MRVLVTGAGGLLGTEFTAFFEARGQPCVALSHRDLDVTDARAVHAALETHRPRVVVHCAAFTHVDAAEARSDEAMAVNRDGAGSVAEAASVVGAGIIHFSTDYVFDGTADRPYAPDAPLRPVNAYGRSKAEGEAAVRGACPQALIVRTGWLFGAGGANFVRTVKERLEEGGRLAVVADQEGRPTWTRHLVEAVWALHAAGCTGVYHVCNAGTATWFEVAREVARAVAAEDRVTATTTHDYARPAPRPAYSVLDLTETEAVLGHPLPDWRTALRGYLEEMR